MDKYESIKDKEQMARIIAFELCPQKYHKEWYGEYARCYADNNYADCAKIKKVVDILYNENYCKLVEGEIVVKEYEMVEKECEIGMLKKTISFLEMQKDQLNKQLEQAEQETAREILQEVVNAWNTGNLNQRELAYICTKYGIELE